MAERTVALTTTMLVDGNNVLVRSLHAASRTSMSNAEGVPTGALVIFINQLSAIIRDHPPDRLLVAWDGGKSTYRLGIDPEYKASRGSHEGPDWPETIWDLAKTFLSLCNIHHVTLAGVEADDIIAWHWRHRDPAEPLVIVSGDKDFFQLLDAQVRQVFPGERNVMEGGNVWAAYGCYPDKMPLIMALTGDAVDGVPGVPGIGPKTAFKILVANDWSLDEALKWGDDPLSAHTPSAKLAGQSARVYRNLALVDLRSEGPDLPLTSVVPCFRPPEVSHLGWSDLMEFLGRYQLIAIQQRLLNRALW